MLEDRPFIAMYLQRTGYELTKESEEGKQTIEYTKTVWQSSKVNRKGVWRASPHASKASKISTMKQMEPSIDKLGNHALN